MAETNSAGTVTRVERYTPYGEPADLQLDAGPGFTGHATDVATGLTYMQQRYYDPEIHRFNSPDPVGPEEDFIKHFNRYNYAMNNPVRYTDPDGRLSRERGPLKSCRETNSCISLAQADKNVKKDAEELVSLVAATAVAGGAAAVATTSSAGLYVSTKSTELYVRGKIALDATVNSKNATSVTITVSAKANQIKTAVMSSAVVQNVANNSTKIIEAVDSFFNPSNNPIPATKAEMAAQSLDKSIEYGKELKENIEK